jgi:hypothetical protein
MLRHLMIAASLFFLAACQNIGPDADYDPNRDYASYRSWTWQEPAVQYQPADPHMKSDLIEQRVREAVAGQLDQRGLRPAAAGTAADLKVQVWLITEEREQEVSTGFGGAWGDPWHGYWGGPGFSETRTYHYRVRTLQIDLHDARDGKLVWRGSAEDTLNERARSPQQRTESIQRSAARALNNFPPH